MGQPPGVAGGGHLRPRADQEVAGEGHRNAPLDQGNPARHHAVVIDRTAAGPSGGQGIITEGKPQVGHLLAQPERPDDREHPVRHIALGTTSPLVERFRERFDELAEALCIEAGKPINDSKGEVTRLVDTFRVAAEESVRSAW